MNNENRFYVLADGTCCHIPDTAPATYLLESVECLAKMPAHILPGSIAYLPNKTIEFQKAVSGKWIMKEPSIWIQPNDFKVEPMGPTETIWGHTVSNMQSNMLALGNTITGTLSYLTEGTLPTDWGAGYFMALKFSGDAFNTAKHIYVGMDPSVSSGLVDIIADPDKNGSFKVSDKDQAVKVVVDYGEYEMTYYYELDLTLTPASN